MSLLVWLPLNGNMNNNGIDNVVITENGGSAVYADGKTGLGLSTSGNKYWTIGPITLTSEASITYWSKTTTNAKMVFTLTCDVYGSLNIYESNIYTLNTGDSNNNPFKNNGNNVNVLHDGLWHHFAVTFDGVSSKLYIDGAYAGTAQTFKSPACSSRQIRLAGGFNNAHSYDWNGMINDFRLYDHCLSPKEVKEISKGLILHYPLDKNNITFSDIGNENLLIGTTLKEIDVNKFLTNSGTDWDQYVRFYNGAVSNHTFTDNGDDFGEDTILLNSNANIGLGFLRKASEISLDSTSNYTLSCEAKCTKAGAELCIGLSYYNTSNTWVWRGGTNPQAFNAVNTWQKFTLTFTPDSNTQCIEYCFTVRGVASGTDTFTIRKCKLEKGSVATAWSKSPHDSKTIFDCSGFENDGVTRGIIENCGGTSRYGSGTTFAHECYIVASEKAKVKDAISVCCWGYMDNWSGYNGRMLSCTETGGWNFEPTGGFLGFVLGTGTSSNTYKTANCTTALANLSSGWHHFVGTYDGFSTKIYIDGVLDGTNNAYTTRTPIYYNTANTIFIGAEAAVSKILPATSPSYFNGKMSDVRIYATALSANDVMELYNTSAYICNNDTLSGYELSECDYPDMTPYSSKIPNEYIELEYLESTGTQYINTGFVPKITPRIVCTVAFMSTDDRDFFGMTNNTQPSWVGNIKLTATTGGKLFSYYRYYTTTALTGFNNNLPSVNAGDFIELDLGNEFIVNGTSYWSTTAQSFASNSQEITLFKGRTYYHKVRIKNCKFYDGDELVRDFIPVMYNYDGYMYDKVTGQLFGNAGTGYFSLGYPTYGFIDDGSSFSGVNIYNRGVVEADEFSEAGHTTLDIIRYGQIDGCGTFTPDNSLYTGGPVTFSEDNALSTEFNEI